MKSYNKQWIQNVIDEYDKKYPEGEDSISMCVVSAKHEQAELIAQKAVSEKSGVVKASSADRRLSLVMPSKLYAILREAYPELLTKDIKWFKANFPVFTIFT